MDLGIAGRVALVTASSRGLGRGAAEALAAEGVQVAICGRDGGSLVETADTLREAGAAVLAIEADVTGPDAPAMLVEQTVERFGRLDILVANAGFGYRRPVVEGDIAVWKDMIDTNVYGLLLTLKYGVAPMLERGGGHVIVMSSVAGRVATPSGAAYCGTKFAASAVADSLRQEVGPKGVRVTAIEPGVVISEFQEKAQYTPDIVANMLKGADPLVPLDIARAVVFALEMPANMGVTEIVVRPTGQAYP